MIDKNAKKLNSKGFTLTELLVTIIIVGLVSGILVAGMGLANNTYKRIVNDANSQVLLSTTTSVLRNELEDAREITVSDDGLSVTYKDTKDRYVTIASTYVENESDTSEFTINKTFMGYQSQSLIPTAMKTGSLSAYFKEIDYIDDRIVVKNITVSNGTKVLGQMETYVIQVH